jgi:hypothetical protein
MVHQRCACDRLSSWTQNYSARVDEAQAAVTHSEITFADESPTSIEFMQVLGGAHLRHAGLSRRISPKLSFQARQGLSLQYHNNTCISLPSLHLLLAR